MNQHIHNLDPEGHGANLQLDDKSEAWTRKMMADLEHFRDVEKGWGEYHTPKNLAMALNVEASELSDIFTWYRDGEAVTEKDKAHAEEELADVMIYSFFMCSRLGLDPLKLIRAKHEINRGRTWPEAE
ncbi:nucleotide pyrophosphohydrolase [Lacticaseibacillus songhuajiangensis]|jgi:NTP pyrophosphatase (non-canonical NTP hydrolase)|uniref:nucleotide pyrophosphohydrolase n=1 Tax=Lacticaseibacillus songhuajiangensis TaxID=1296539 RepID=UPI000F778F70|nr:nucleotide pyrophosphohydrolase [Lacticaseibacillus songhuajiangensis]MCI1283256.1 nucleotide pyrophosphohydrolase [Lacticaseibacillus songhuajiangensis]